MAYKRTYRAGSLCLRAEELEARTVLSGTAIVQPFSEVDYFGDANDWSVNAINAPEVWARGHTGEQVIVAVIDTGVDLQHPDLARNIWINSDEIDGNGIDDDGNGYIDDRHGWNFAYNNATTQDSLGHGTHIAGTIAAARNRLGSTGVAYNAKIMPVRVIDDDGLASQIHIGAGIRYAVENGADIINLSLGGLGSRRVSSSIQFAKDNEVLIVAAAGNSSASEPDFPARYSATFDNVLSVGAHDNNLARSDFSNLVGDSESVQVEGPGEGVYSTGLARTYHFSGGTSTATAHVSGVAALTKSARPELSADRLRTLIVDGANFDVSGSDAAGGINAAFTVALATPAEAVATVQGDINRDGEVNFSDFLILSRNFGSEVTQGIDPQSVGDLDGDGQVLFFDFLVLSRAFGVAPPPPVIAVDAIFGQELSTVL